MYDIIDLSNNNDGRANLNLAQRTGTSGLWHKVSEGRTFTDKFWDGPRAYRRNDARAIHMPVGGYHMLRRHNAIEQARRFCNLLGPHTLRAVCDAEFQYDAQGHVTDTWPGPDDVAAFLTEVERILGYTPILYTFTSFLQLQLRNDPRLARFPLWIASYTVRPPDPGRPYVAWQYTDDGPTPGVGPCDHSHVPDLKAVLVPTAVPLPDLPKGFRPMFMMHAKNGTRSLVSDQLHRIALSDPATADAFKSTLGLKEVPNVADEDAAKFPLVG